MARVRKIINSFISGEWSKYVFGRTDLEKYYKAASIIENWIIKTSGGVTRRPGYRFCALTKFQDGRATRLMDFPSTAGDGYILEVGDLYIWFFYDGLPVFKPGFPTERLEVVTPYVSGDVFELHEAQVADVKYIAHRNYDPRKLINDEGVFTLSKIRFNPPPSKPVTFSPAATLTPAATTGADITFTASAGVFATANINQQIEKLGGTGLATIVSITDPSNVKADITEDFDNTSAMASGTGWRLTGPLNTTLTPTVAKPVGAITDISSDQPVFASAYVGLFIKLNGGLVKITSFADTTHISAKILGELTGITPAGPATWSLEADTWKDNPPDTVAFHEDRLWFGRGIEFWGSRTDDFENFAVGAKDDDAVEFVIAVGSPISGIRWMLSAEDLIIGTGTQELKASGGTNQAITAGNISVRPLTSHGSTRIQPTKQGGSIIFVERGRTRVRELLFDFESNAFQSRDLNLLAEHIAESGMVQFARQKRPYQVTWFVNGKGELCGFSLDFIEQILSWQRQTVRDGGFSSAA